jgi:hypothetical protein
VRATIVRVWGLFNNDHHDERFLFYSLFSCLVFALDVELGGYAKESPGELWWHGGVTAVRKLHKWNSTGTGIHYGMV